MTTREMFDYFVGIGFTPEATAGLLGNLKAESNLNAKNLQNSGNNRLGMTDDEYTAAVDSGTYTNFVCDSIGYGLAQWTFWSRKEELLKYATARATSIGDCKMQCEFLNIELKRHKTVYQVLKTTKSIREASDIVLTQYEKPANQSDAVKAKRAEYGQAIFDECTRKEEIKMGKYASNVLKQAAAWVGKKESDSTHKEIVDVYNGHKPLARNYKVKYTDSWCATFVSAVAIKLGYTDIIPTECSCQKMIDLFKQIGCWVENENITPEAGWILFYDWQDNGTGDNQGWSDHVGIVEKVSGGRITVIEGNYQESVKRRVLYVNGKYIRGYGAPRYDKENSGTVEVVKGNVKAKDSAKSYTSSLAGTYKVTASALNVRHGAGTLKAKMVAIPKGTEVKCYGYFTTALGTKWLYIQFEYNGVNYTGFASQKYLAK